MEVIAALVIGCVVGFIFCLFVYDEEITRGLTKNHIYKNITDLGE